MTQLQEIKQLVQEEFEGVNQLILSSLESRVETINQIGNYIIAGGGKRVRPLLVLLSTKACQAPSETQRQAAITMATLVEFIHTATLLHDDVVDHSELRRGKLTANAVWDNATAVLVGDFIYSRAFQMIASLNNMEAIEILAEATNVIAEGEVMQLTHRHQPDISETQYFQVIECKTSKLFEAACLLGGVIAEQPRALKQDLTAYGRHIGNAFQLVDDVLDYQADLATWGKNIGDDLAEGKITLPLIYALSHGPQSLVNTIREAILAKGTEEMATIQKGIAASGAIDYTMQRAKEEAHQAQQCLARLPESCYREALFELANFVVGREN